MQEWFDTTLGDEFKIVMGQSPASEYYNDKGQGLPFFQGKKEFGELYPKIEVWTTQATKRANEGDILLSVRAPIGDVNIAPKECGIGRELAAIKPNDKTCSKFILYLLKAKENELKKRGAGVTFSAITKPNLFSLPIRVPLGKQGRDKIVQAVETQFTRLDATIKSLKVIEEKLSVYRRSILHNAFDGKLAQQSKNEWQIKPIKEICVLVNGRAFKPNEWAKSGLPIIRIQNLNNELALFNYCNFEVEEKYYVNKGDLLFAWSGTPGTSFGAHIWEGPRAVLNQHIFKVLIDEEKINKKFLMYVLNKNVGQYIQKAHGTAGLAHITKGKFENSEIKIPSKEIQDEVVQDIEFKFSVLDKVDESVDKTLTKANCLRRSILKSAFEGKLI